MSICYDMYIASLEGDLEMGYNGGNCPRNNYLREGEAGMRVYF